MSDTFSLFLSQLLKDFNGLSNQVTNVFALVGAFYALKYTSTTLSDFGCGLFSLRTKLFPKNFVKVYGRWAVVTGCTSGIGEAFSFELASKGLNIVLVGRDKAKLAKLASQIEVNYGVDVMTIQADLEKFDEEMWQLFNNLSLETDIGILINNAGLHYNYPKKFHNVDYARVSSITAVNVDAPMKLAHAILPGMVSRKRGLIVNMSSYAGCIHSPLISLYSASKACVDHFSQSLHYELRSSDNIFVQSLTPMYINTRMTEYSSLLNMSGIFTPTPHVYAKSAVFSFGRFVSNTGYFPHTLQTWIIGKLPNWFTVLAGHYLQKYLNREGLRREKEE